jgi:hypothetical protein
MKRKQFCRRADHRHLEGGRGGRGGDGAVPQARDVERDLLCVEGQVRRSGSVRREAAAGARGGERQAQAAAGGHDARQRGVEGSAVKKW